MGNMLGETNNSIINNSHRMADKSSERPASHMLPPSTFMEDWEL
jgi:hypothetical protein